MDHLNCTPSSIKRAKALNILGGFLIPGLKARGNLPPQKINKKRAKALDILVAFLIPGPPSLYSFGGEP